MEELKFFVITDTHYFENSLGAHGSEYKEFMRFQQKSFAESEYINKKVFEYLKKSDEADIVLIAGDLTFNGEKANHVGFIKLLRELEESGKRVYVTTADHDVKARPFAFTHSGKKRVERTDFSELYDMYKDFGYGSAIALNRKHMSYVAQLSDNVRLLVLCNDMADAVNTEYDEEMLSWIKEQARKAKADSQLMIAMQHYPLIAGQPVLSLMPHARQKGSLKLIETLADNGVQLVFTGHMHCQSINTVKTAAGNSFYDVCTGSVVAYPPYMRLVSIAEDKTISIESKPLPEFCMCGSDKPSDQYLKDLFANMVHSLISNMQRNPQMVLRRFSLGGKPLLRRPVKVLGRILETYNVGKAARLLLIRVDKSIKDMELTDFITDVVISIFEGNQPYRQGTAGGDFILKVAERMAPMLRKLKGAQGERLDFYELVKNSVGNYGISDYSAVIKPE